MEEGAWEALGSVECGANEPDLGWSLEQSRVVSIWPEYLSCAWRNDKGSEACWRQY